MVIDIPSRPPTDGDEDQVRRWREEMTLFRHNTIMAAQRNAHIFVSGVEQQCRNSIAEAMERMIKAETASSKIKADAAVSEKAANVIIVRLKSEIQEQVSIKISSAADLRKLLAAETARADAGEAMVNILQTRIDAPAVSSDDHLSNALHENIETLLFGVDSDANLFDNLDLHEANPIDPVTTDKCVDDAETKSLKAAMEGRGMLIKAIVAAVHDPALKAAVDALMKNAVPMPPTFDELVNMLRSHRASPSHDFRL
jgi:hypothetical protein